MLGSYYQEMPLPELRCNGEHMPKSTGQILFDSKCEVEREIKTGKGCQGERERDRKREREVKQRCHHHVDSDGVPLALLFWSSWW